MLTSSPEQTVRAYSELARAMQLYFTLKKSEL